MKCPFCAHDDTQVKDSRPSDDGKTIRRRRECPNCGRRFTTFERFQVQQVMVVKRDGRKELFDRDKVISSLLTALRKRPVTQQQIGQLASEIEQKFTESGRNEVPTREVGDAVLAGLRGLDFIAYLRYASVYHDFAGPEDVVKLMEESNG